MVRKSVFSFMLLLICLTGCAAENFVTENKAIEASIPVTDIESGAEGSTDILQETKKLAMDYRRLNLTYQVKELDFKESMQVTISVRDAETGKYKHVGSLSLFGLSEGDKESITILVPPEISTPEQGVVDIKLKGFASNGTTNSKVLLDIKNSALERMHSE